MKRRSFLRHVTHSVAVPGVLGAMGFRMPGPASLNALLRTAASTDRVLVLIFLEGGNDGLNTVIPLDQLSALNKVRPHVILPDEALLELANSKVALHPALSGFKSLYNESRLQIIQNVGYPDQNYSHFRSTDIWMSGSDANELVNSGWAGRFLDDTFPGYPDDYPNEGITDPLSVELGYGSSLLFQGTSASMSMVISSPDNFYQLVNNEEEPAPTTPAGEKLKYVRLIAKQSQQYGEVVKAAATKVKSQADYPDTGLGQQLKIVSRLIAGGLQTPLYLVRLGGFDTHDAQVEEEDHTTGEHNELLTTLNDAVMAFMNDLEMQGTDDRVVGMTFSEFGRRIVSNASLGTDHGAAAPLFFFGNAVRGGVVGTNPEISSFARYDDNLDWQYDIRQLYGSILGQWLGASESQLDTVLFDGYDQIDIIGENALLGHHGEKPKRPFTVYPNPLSNRSTIHVIKPVESAFIDVIDLTGRQVQAIYRGRLSQGQKLSWDTCRLAPGRYLVVLTSSEGRASFPVVKLQ